MGFCKQKHFPENKSEEILIQNGESSDFSFEESLVIQKQLGQGLRERTVYTVAYGNDVLVIRTRIPLCHAHQIIIIYRKGANFATF